MADGIVPMEGPVAVMPTAEQGDATTDNRAKAAEVALVRKWVERVNDTPEHTRLARETAEIIKTLRPERWDKNDPYRGLVQQEIKTKADDVRVQTPLVARNAKMLQAMAIPEDHIAQWRPRRQLQRDLLPMPTVLLEHRKRFGETLQLVQEAHHEDCRWQEVIEHWTFDGICYPIAWLKIVYDAGEGGEPQESVEQTQTIDDEGEARAKLRELVAQYAEGAFGRGDDRWLTMQSLTELLGDDTEGDLTVRSALRAEVIPPSRIYVDPSVRSTEKAMSAAWICHETFLDKTSLGRYRLREVELPDGTTTEVGLTQAEIDSLFQGSSETTDNPRRGTSLFRAEDTTSGTMGNDAEIDASQATAEARTVRVWEIWCRAEQQVHVILPDEQFQRRLDTWRPQRTPEQWYPFVDLVLLPLGNSLAGASLANWGRDPQNRRNRKRGDQEKARWLSLPRWGVDASLGDRKEFGRLQDKAPFAFFTANLNGRSWDDVIKEFSAKFDPTAFSTIEDDQELAETMGINDATRGVLGQAKFATEVQAGVQGLSAWATHLQTQLRRAVARAYKVSAELLIQHMPARLAQEIAGPGAVWPMIYSEAEAQAAQQRIAMQVAAYQASLEDRAQAAVAMYGPEAAELAPQMVQQQVAALREKLMTDVFGLPEPVTRERLFRACVLRIDVALDAQIDRQARIGSMERVAGTILALAQAGQAMGRRFDPEPVLRNVCGFFGIQDPMESIFPAVDLPMGPPPGPPPSGGAGGPAPEEPSGASEDEGTGPAPADRVQGAVGTPSPVV